MAFSGKTCIVTGGTRGIGAVCVARLGTSEDIADAVAWLLSLAESL